MSNSCKRLAREKRAESCMRIFIRMALPFFPRRDFMLTGSVIKERWCILPPSMVYVTTPKNVVDPPLRNHFLSTLAIRLLSLPHLLLHGLRPMLSAPMGAEGDRASTGLSGPRTAEYLQVLEYIPVLDAEAEKRLHRNVPFCHAIYGLPMGYTYSKNYT